MPRTPENLPRHELIGLKAEVEDHPDLQKEDISGEVLDETRDMIRIGEKWVEKQDTVFLFKLDDKKVRIHGNIINKRPEDRLQMKLPNKWDELDK
jgi:ribonuclease P protein subunit POP4